MVERSMCCTFGPRRSSQSRFGSLATEESATSRIGAGPVAGRARTRIDGYRTSENGIEGRVESHVHDLPIPDNRLLILVGDVGRDGRVAGSFHELARCCNPAWGEDGIDVVPVDVVDLALFDVAMNDVGLDDVSFRIRSPHRAEASLCRSRFLCFCGHIFSKESPPSGGEQRRLVVGYCEWCHS